ncbi:MAG: transglutaminase-like domain-containing protein [Dehalococcoidia bacterium]|jgi:transglutaminase-like putative cysteine protease
MERFLKPTNVIDSDHPTVREKSGELIEGKEDVIEKAKSLFYFVRDEIKYNIYVSKSRPEYFKASRTLSRKEGYCVQKAVLLVALGRAAGIPAGLGFARLRNNLLPQKTVDWLGGNIIPFHGYAEFYLNGDWVKATPAFDLKLCQKNRFVPVEFDGRTDAMFPLHDQDERLHFEYIKDLGRHYDDLPLEKLFKALIKTAGPHALEPPPP